MKKLALAAASGVAALAFATTAFAQGPTEKVRKLNLYSWPQAALPQSYQAAQLIAQQWRQLGLDVDVKPLQRQQQTQLIWFSRDKWDVTMWRMVGRPERSDPDEFFYSLYHSSYAEKGYNFIGYLNPEYDKLAEKQRTQLDREERRKTAFEMQKIIDRDQPQAFLVHPKYALAFNKAVFKEDTVVNQTGIGIRNIWTFIAHPAAGRAEGHDHQQQRGDQRHQPALYRRRGRQLGHRPDLGPPDAHRPRRHAAAVGGRERRLGRRQDDRRRRCAPA